MRIRVKKIIYGSMLLVGAVLVLAPFVAAIINGDESFITNRLLLFSFIIPGLAITIAAGIYAQRVFYCPSCKQRLTTPQDGTTGTSVRGLTGAFKLLAIKRCPICGAALE